MAMKPTLYRALSPAEEPIDLVEAKLFLRVDHSNEDALIGNMIKAAREAAERYMSHSLMSQTWVAAYDGYMPSEVVLPKGPVQTITSVKIVASNNTETVLNTSSYSLFAEANKLHIGTSLLGHIIAVKYVAGYTDAQAVPDDIKQGILHHVAALYDERPNSVGMPAASLEVYNSYRKLRV